MQRYNILQAIFLSFFSKKLYQDVVMHWGGKTFLYLLMLVFLSWIPLTLLWAGPGLGKEFNLFTDKFLMQIPPITVKDGKIHTPENHPYIINDNDTHERVMVIDTSGQFKTPQEANTPILLTQTTLITQTDNQSVKELKSYDIPKSASFTFTPNLFKDYLKAHGVFIWSFFAFLILIIGCIGSFFYRVIEAVLYSVLGLIFNAMCHAQLTYMQILSVMLIALTPTIVVATILGFFGISFAFQPLLYFGLAMVYLFYGIYATKSRFS